MLQLLEIIAKRNLSELRVDTKVKYRYESQRGLTNTRLSVKIILAAKLYSFKLTTTRFTQ